MSTVLDKPTESTSTAVVVRPETRPRTSPIARPATPIEVAPRPMPRGRSTSWPKVVAMKAALFASVLTVAFLSSSLVGQVKLESARQTRLHAADRASAARSAEAILSQQVDHLTSAQGIESWAIAHAFTSPDGSEKNAKSLVAQR